MQALDEVHGIDIPKWLTGGFDTDALLNLIPEGEARQSARTLARAVYRQGALDARQDIRRSLGIGERGDNAAVIRRF